MELLPRKFRRNLSSRPRRPGLQRRGQQLTTPTCRRLLLRTVRTLRRTDQCGNLHSLVDLTQDLQGQTQVGPLSRSANPKFKGTPYVPPPPPKPLQDPGSSGAVARPQGEGWSPYDYPIVRDFTALARLEGRQAPLGSMEKFRQIAKDLDMAPPGVAGSLVCQHKGYMYAPLDLVGYEGQLPAGSKESQVFLRLRPHRHRVLPPKLRNKGFSLAGYCLEPCVFHRLCATACSRTVCVEANATHDRHVCQGCEEQGVPSRPQWPPGSPGYVA